MIQVSVGAVQSFIAEARTTADLRNGSAICSDLAGKLAEEMDARGAALVFPAVGHGSPNRIVATVPDSGAGAQLAKDSVEAATAWWVQRAGGGPLPLPVTWVVATGADYASVFVRLGELAEARKRTRMFDAYSAEQDELCSLTGRFPGKPHNWRGRRVEVLSDLSWVKRNYRSAVGTWSTMPSTRTIVWAGRHRAALGALPSNPGLQTHCDALAAAESERRGTAVSFSAIDSSRLDPEAWWEDFDADDGANTEQHEASREVRERGARAAAALAGAVREVVAAAPVDVTAEWMRGLRAATTHLAVVVQDVDHMGRHLGGEEVAADGDLAAFHRKVSAALSEIAKQQETITTTETAGRLVYAGGDDALALVPAADALRLSQRLRAASLDGLRPHLPALTVSSAVVYFPPDYPLQRAIARARKALDDAKRAGRDRIEVVHLNGGGERASAVVRWPRPQGGDAVDELEALAALRVGGKHLAADLLADLMPLTADDGLARGELARRAARRGGVSTAQALDAADRVCALASAGGALAPQLCTLLQLLGELEELA